MKITSENITMREIQKAVEKHATSILVNENDIFNAIQKEFDIPEIDAKEIAENAFCFMEDMGR